MGVSTVRRAGLHRAQPRRRPALRRHRPADQAVMTTQRALPWTRRACRGRRRGAAPPASAPASRCRGASHSPSIGPDRHRRVGGDRALRPADRPAEPASAELRDPGRAVVGALVRHRRAGPRRASPGCCPAPGSRCRCAVLLVVAGDDHRRGDRRLRRVLRRLGRQRDHAAGRPRSSRSPASSWRWPSPRRSARSCATR